MNLKQGFFSHRTQAAGQFIILRPLTPPPHCWLGYHSPGTKCDPAECRRSDTFVINFVTCFAVRGCTSTSLLLQLHVGLIVPRSFVINPSGAHRPPAQVQGGSNMTGTNCDLFTHKSVPVIFEPPCTFGILNISV